MSKWPGKHHTFSDPSTAVLYMEICFSKLKFYSFYAITRRLTVSTWDEPIKKQLWRGQEVTTFLGKGITVLRLWSLWIGTQLVIYITPSVFVSYQHHCLNFPQIGWMLMLCKDWWFKFKQNTRLRAAFGTLFSVQRYQKTCYNKQVVSASLVGYKIFNTRRGFTIHDSSQGNIRHEFTMATILCCLGICRWIQEFKDDCARNSPLIQLILMLQVLHAETQMMQPSSVHVTCVAGQQYDIILY